MIRGFEPVKPAADPAEFFRYALIAFREAPRNPSLSETASGMAHDTIAAAFGEHTAEGRCLEAVLAAIAGYRAATGEPT